MELVEATATKIDELVERWHALGKEMETYDKLNELKSEDIEDMADDGFRSHLDDEETTDYLVVDDDETIGFVTLRQGSNPTRTYSQYLRIVNLAIDEDHRNQGHGTAVIERVKQMARDRDCDHIMVSCEWQNDDARRFYRETGFRPKQIDYAYPLD